MRFALYSTGILLTILIQGCTNQPDVKLTLNLESTEPSIVAETQQVLSSRFQQFRPSIFSSIESRIEGSRIIFTFKNGAPDRAVLEYLYETMGVLRASLIEDNAESIWFTNGDIETAVSGYSESESVLFISLRPEAGQRVLKLSSESVGKVVRTTLDGQVVLEATVRDPFSRQFQLTAPDADRADELATILNSGALPTRVSGAQLQNGI